MSRQISLSETSEFVRLWAGSREQGTEHGARAGSRGHMRDACEAPNSKLQAPSSKLQAPSSKLQAPSTSPSPLPASPSCRFTSRSHRASRPEGRLYEQTPNAQRRTSDAKADCTRLRPGIARTNGVAGKEGNEGNEGSGAQRAKREGVRAGKFVAAGGAAGG